VRHCTSDWLPSGGVDPIKRHSQGNLKRDLARARGQRNVGLDPLHDLAGISKLGVKPLHHRFDVGEDGLPLTTRSDAVLERLRIPAASLLALTPSFRLGVERAWLLRTASAFPLAGI